jgi:hypothetical protein
MLCVGKQYELGNSHRLNIEQDRMDLPLYLVAKSLAVVVAVVWCCQVS